MKTEREQFESEIRITRRGKLAAATSIIALAGAGGYVIYESVNDHEPFNADMCEIGVVAAGKGGISAVNDALRNMPEEVSESVSDQSRNKLGRTASELSGGALQLGSTVEVCVDLDTNQARVTLPNK